VAEDRDQTTSAIAREHLLTGSLGMPGERIEAYRVTLPPAQKAGRHVHPGGVVGYVVAGEIVFEVADQPATVLRQGSVFYEPPGATIARFDNVSDTASAEFIAFYPLTGDQTLMTFLDGSPPSTTTRPEDEPA
jgi:quercetin dioxygenase-like cupin family protein